MNETQYIAARRQEMMANQRPSEYAKAFKKEYETTNVTLQELYWGTGRHPTLWLNVLDFLKLHQSQHDTLDLLCTDIVEAVTMMVQAKEYARTTRMSATTRS